LINQTLVSYVKNGFDKDMFKHNYFYTNPWVEISKLKKPFCCKMKIGKKEIKLIILHMPYTCLSGLHELESASSLNRMVNAGQAGWQASLIGYLLHVINSSHTF
jgi:hypothetical protein